jgi:hypothetical protein
MSRHGVLEAFALINMVVWRRRFETTCRSHLQGPSSPTTNPLRVKPLKSEDPSLMGIFSFMLTCVRGNKGFVFGCWEFA